ncbi:MAG: DUF4115 domain-containing protein [Lactobacillaceae bacterium]|jgi:cytoskeletal protein RodZ|nr:DUF4115 domain-containing protein [Lactobacillaceae bacterium]
MTEERSRAIGEELQAARLDKGLSLDDIQATTKIQKRYLAAIENGQFDQLPGAFYERAFTRQYAAAVGIDADSFLKVHNEIPQANEVEADLSNARVDTDNVTRAGMHRQEESAIEKTRSIIPKIIVGIVILAVIAAIWFVVSSFAGNAKQQISNDDSKTTVTSSKVASSTQSSEVKTSSSAESSKASSAKSSSEAPKTEIGQPTIAGNTSTIEIKTKLDTTHKLTLIASGDVWSQATVNGQQVVYQTITGGSTQDVALPAGTNSIVLNFGNANNVKVQFDGKDVALNNASLVWGANINLVNN